MKYAYYPGCTLISSAIEYDMSTRAVCEALGIELADIEDWNCCGASAAYSIDNLLSYALPARNLAIAEKMGLDVVAPCSACSHNLLKVNKAVEDDPELMEKVNKILEETGVRYEGTIKAKHLLDAIVNDLGIDAVSSKVTRELEGLKVAPYYGCLIVKPPDIANFDSPEDPQSMDEIITAVGAEVVPFRDFKTKCCGGPVLLTREDVALELTKNILEGAKRAGADCILVNCPLCHMNVDAKQPSIEKTFKVEINLPVLYFTQLMGLALEIEPKKLGLDKNLISTKPVIKAVA
ncbi:MAG: CoB--CoM heterodisulfide reductase iron-sulfur subunit B family protein [Candidatus Hydrothermarchaeales archaeon]